MSIGRTIKALARSNDRRFVALLSEQADLTIRALQTLERFGQESSADSDIIDEIKEIEREGVWGTQIRQDGRLAIPDIAKAFSFGRSVGSDTSREPLAAIGRVGFTQRPASARANTHAGARRVSRRTSPALT